MWQPGWWPQRLATVPKSHVDKVVPGTSSDFVHNIDNRQSVFSTSDCIMEMTQNGGYPQTIEVIRPWTFQPMVLPPKNLHILMLKWYHPRLSWSRKHFTIADATLNELLSIIWALLKMGAPPNFVHLMGFYLINLPAIGVPPSKSHTWCIVFPISKMTIAWAAPHLEPKQQPLTKWIFTLW